MLSPIPHTVWKASLCSNCNITTTININTNSIRSRRKFVKLSIRKLSDAVSNPSTVLRWVHKHLERENGGILLQMHLLAAPFLPTTNSLCQGMHESYIHYAKLKRMKARDAEIDGRHLSLLYPPAYARRKKGSPIYSVISYASVQHCIVQATSAVEQGSCQQGDEIQQCSAGSTTGKRKQSARQNLLGKTGWVTTCNTWGLQLYPGSTPHRQVTSITTHPSYKIRPQIQLSHYPNVGMEAELSMW